MVNKLQIAIIGLLFGNPLAGYSQTRCDSVIYMVAIVSQLNAGIGEVNISEYRDALGYLARTTGMVSRSDFSSTVGYRSKKEFDADLNKWFRWVRKNRPYCYEGIEFNKKSE